MSYSLTHYLFAGLIGLATSAQAQEKIELTETEWQIKQFHCPASCSKELKEALQGQLGGKVTLGPSEFSGALISSCDAVTEVTTKLQSQQEKIDDIKKLGAQWAKFNFASLQLPAQLTTADVYCKSSSQGRGAGASIISIENERLLLLLEDQLIIELKK